MSLKNILRSLRLKMGKFILDRKTRNPLPNPIQKIIFLRHDGKIGDYIVSSFVFRELKKQNPNLHIGVVCSTKIQSLFEKNPYIDQLYPVKTKSIASYIKVATQIRQQYYDILIDLTTFLRNRDLLLIKLINAKINLGYQKQHYRLFDLSVNDNTLHFSQIYQQALEMLGYHHISSIYDIPLDMESEQKAQYFLAQYHLHSFIAINFFGASSARTFNDEQIIQWLHYIQQYTSKSIVLLTYPAVTDKLKFIIQSFKNIFILENTETIFDNIALIRNADLIISPDTSIIHIAAGLNKPMITFYNNDHQNFTHWHPNSQNTVHLLRYSKNINELKPAQLLPEWLK